VGWAQTDNKVQFQSLRHTDNITLSQKMA